MLRRFFIFLLTVCLAAPALAMPVAPAPAPMVHASHAGGGHGHHPQAPDHGGKHHECIGCIAPLFALPHADRPVLPKSREAMPGRTSPLLTRQSPPETPPPRA